MIVVVHDPPTMMQFMQQIRANMAQQAPGKDEGRVDWSEDVTYHCLTPVSNAFAQEIRQSLQKLTGLQGFPLPYPVVLKQADLAKLSKFEYRALACRGELRMALCFLQVGDRKTVTVLVSENMMVVRVRMSKVPYGVFKGSVFAGFATPSKDGGADFVVSDCLYYRGKNMARRPFQERLDSCISCVDEATREISESGFRLSVAPTWNVQGDDLWNALEDDDSWTSVLFVPASLAIKTGTVQSTLFEHSSIDFKDVADALTESVSRPDLLKDCRGTSSWADDIPEEETSQESPGVVVTQAVPVETVVFVAKTYSEALGAVTDGVGSAEEPVGQAQGGPAAASELDATS